MLSSCAFEPSFIIHDSTARAWLLMASHKAIGWFPATLAMLGHFPQALQSPGEDTYTLLLAQEPLFLPDESKVQVVINQSGQRIH